MPVLRVDQAAASTSGILTPILDLSGPQIAISGTLVTGRREQ
jgi:hypothetical protein